MSENESTLTDVQADNEQEGTMATGTSARKMTAVEVYQAVKKLVKNEDDTPTGVTVKAATEQVAKQAGRSQDTVRETYYRIGRDDKNSAIKSRAKSRRNTGGRRPSYTRMTEDGGVNGDGKAPKAAPKATPKRSGMNVPTREEINAVIERAMDTQAELIAMLKQTSQAAETFEAIREQFASV